MIEKYSEKVIALGFPSLVISTRSSFFFFFFFLLY